mmetsp:Transcript_17192/g.2375  ORF Transcript_17192/g.2375 Transcript_17192/m.2375 type:complete len:81 (+) Transcript_17192:61-303(+)
MNNNGATTKYPIWLKTVLKTTPAFCVFFMFGGLFCTAIYDIIYHPHDRIERFHFRSNKFERLARKRDEKLRYYYAPMINW